MRLLVDAGANLSDGDDAGNTALGIAVVNRHLGVVRVLLNAGEGWNGLDVRSSGRALGFCATPARY